MKILTIYTAVTCVCAGLASEESLNDADGSVLQSTYQTFKISPDNDCDFEKLATSIRSYNGFSNYLSVPLDHFSKDAGSNKLMMPYTESSQSFLSGGPIYVLICEKFAKDKNLLENGLLRELASETHGTLFAVGQRCTRELTPKSFEYLTTNQILHDIAQFITVMKEQEKYKHSKVVIVGRRSAGKLAYWMKQKFNNLVDVVITDIKPNLQLEDSSNIKNIADFFRTIGGDACVKHIGDKLRNQQKLLRQPDGAEELRKQEILCPGTNFTDNVHWYTYNAVVYSQLINSISLDQYQWSQLCNNLKQVPDVDNADYCFVLPNATHWKSRANYLQCNEYGMFATSNASSAIPLDIPLKWYMDTCRQNYGEKFNEDYIKTAVKNTIEEYKLTNPSKIVFLSENSGVTLSSTSDSRKSGVYVHNWDELDGVERVKTSVKEFINYLEYRSIDKYSFFLPSQSVSAPN